jgi:pimeloyl-ACP methyl ester carboxylesterase
MHLVSSGTGYPVLFLHGIPTTCQLWTGVIKRMHGRFTCIAVDLPCYRDLPKLAAGLDEIRARCGIKKWHVVGHDGGCALAVHYADRFPERVGCLALMSPSIFPDLKPFFLFEILRKPVLGELMAPLVSLLFWKYVMPVATGRNAALTYAISDFRKSFQGFQGAWLLMSLLRWGHPAQVLSTIPAILPGLRTPTLILHGLRDPAVPEAFARRAAKLLPDAEVAVLDSGHFFPLCEPELVASKLLRFFAERGTVESAPTHAGVSVF